MYMIYIHIYIYIYIYLYIYISIHEEEQVKKWPFKWLHLPDILVFGIVIAVIVAVFITAVLTLETILINILRAKNFIIERLHSHCIAYGNIINRVNSSLTLINS